MSAKPVSSRLTKEYIAKKERGGEEVSNQGKTLELERKVHKENEREERRGKGEDEWKERKRRRKR